MDLLLRSRVVGLLSRDGVVTTEASLMTVIVVAVVDDEPMRKVTLILSQQMIQALN